MQITNNNKTISSFEDFLDLSKWRAPVTIAVLERRLFDNLCYFSSNYIWIWFVLTFTWGLWLNWKVLASFIIIAIAWFGSLEFEKSSSGNTKTKLDEKNGPKKSSSSFLMWLIPFSAFICYVLSALLPILLTGCLTLIIAACHSVMRPLVNEALIIQQQTKAREEQKKLVSSKKPGVDDGIDLEREDVIIFTHNTPNSPSRDVLLRAAASKRIWNQQKMATATSSSRTVPYVDISVGDGLHDKPKLCYNHGK